MFVWPRYNVIAPGRDVVLDVFKGLGIVLVIIGHVIQSTDTLFDSNIFFKIIYSFHMAFFFFLSGLVSSRCTGDKVIKMAGRLLVPFVAWFILRTLLDNGFDFVKLPHNILELMKRPDQGLWFLLILFEAFLVLWLITLMEKRLGVYAYLLGVLIIAIPHVPTIPLLRRYLLFFLLGHFITLANLKYLRLSVVPLLLITICYACLMLGWHRTDNVDFSSIIGLLQQSYTLNFMLTEFYRLIVATCGIIIFANICFRISDFKSSSLIAVIGFYSLDVYAVHQVFLFGRLKDIINSFLNETHFMSALIITSILTMMTVALVRQSFITSRVLFGIHR